MKKNYLLFILIFVLTNMATAQIHTSLKQRIKNRRNHIGLNKGFNIKSHIANKLNTKQFTFQKPAGTNRKKLDSIVSLSWDANSSQWVKDIDSYKVKNIYDGYGNNTLAIWYDWDEHNKVWVVNDKSNYTYDTDGNPLIEQDSFWNINTNQWVNNSKFEYTYDVSSNVLSEIYYSWNDTTNQFNKKDKTEWSYDINGNEILNVSYNYNSTISQWDETSKTKTDYSLNGNGTVASSIGSDWDYTNSQWIVNVNSIYTYDTSNNLTLISEVIGNYKVDYSYDTNGNIISEKDYEFNTNANQWDITSKADYAFDLTELFSDNIMPNNIFFAYYTDSYNYHMVNLPSEFTYYDLVNQVLTQQSKDKFYYSDYISNSTTTIPDTNFEQALIDLGIDSDGVINQSVLTSDISGVTSLDVSSKNISDLTGIEDFESIETLNCSNNTLTSLDLSNCTILTDFDSTNNPALICIIVSPEKIYTVPVLWYKDTNATYSITCNDSDNDGVINSLDYCTNTPQGDVVDTNGCSFTQEKDALIALYNATDGANWTNN